MITRDVFELRGIGQEQSPTPGRAQGEQAGALKILGVTTTGAQVVANGGTGETTQKIPMRDLEQKLLLKGHRRGVSAVKFSPNGLLIASCSADATIKIWEIATGRLLHTLEGHLAGINTIAWSSDSRTIASGSDDKSIRLWDVLTGKPHPEPLLGHHNYVYSIAFSPKGNMIVSGSFDEAVFLWDVRSARVMRALPAHSDPVAGCDFIRDGSLIASCAGDGLIRIWDTVNGQCLKTMVDEDRRAVTCVRFSPNGKFVLAWTLDSSIRLWEYVTGKRMKTYQGHENSRYSLQGTFGSYAGGTESFVVSGSEDGSIFGWDITSKAEMMRLSGHKGPVMGVDTLTMDDGRGLMVSGGLDKTIRIWEEVSSSDGDVTNGGEVNGVSGAVRNGLERDELMHQLDGILAEDEMRDAEDT